MVHSEKSRKAIISHLLQEEEDYQGMRSVGRIDSAALALGGPMMVLNAAYFLLPQYEGAIKEFKAHSREWLQKMARLCLEESASDAAPEVVARWRSIADGSFFED